MPACYLKQEPNNQAAVLYALPGTVAGTGSHPPTHRLTGPGDAARAVSAGGEWAGVILVKRR